jgi:putative ABC transport system permease protein
MEFHRLKIGSSIYPIINGKRVELKISGKAISPEYIYAVPSAQDMMPDNERFTILYLEHSFVQQLLGYDGLVNEVVVQIDDRGKRTTGKKGTGGQAEALRFGIGHRKG